MIQQGTQTRQLMPTRLKTEAVPDRDGGHARLLCQPDAEIYIVLFAICRQQRPAEAKAHLRACLTHTQYHTKPSQVPQP